MRSLRHSRFTIGFLSTWSVYEGTAIDDYTHALLEGIRAAARDHDCNLLIGCGMSLPGSPLASRTAWAVPGADMDFIPVGPWNTDGMIIIPDDLTDPQFEYVQDLVRSDYPVMLTTAEKPGPAVAVDNAGGIRQAFEHLIQHGHRQIAFIAGKNGRGGDSAERLSAYRESLRNAGMEEDERLIAFGEHRRENGQTAMQQILNSGAAFSAILASNDLSGIGAMEALRNNGRRVPEDVAVIGFDDIQEARSQNSLLTTVRHPTFSLGYQALTSILELINGRKSSETSKRVATRLVIRHSCGCRPESMPVASLPSLVTLESPKKVRQALKDLMAETASIETRQSTPEEIDTLCRNFIDSFIHSLKRHDSTKFDGMLQRLVDLIEIHEDDTYAWHITLSALHRGLPNLLSVEPGIDPTYANGLLDRARLAVAEIAQCQETVAMLRRKEISNRLGLMTSELLSAFDIPDIASIMVRHIPLLGIRHILAATYSSIDDDLFANTMVLLDVGSPINRSGQKFLTREFPPKDFYSSQEAFQLAILPMTIDEKTTGFVALSATNLELCAVIVRNLTAALRTSRLYRDALEGRELAEDANRMKSRFLSMVSHELRTPLSLIVGLSEMLMRKQSKLSELVLRDLEQINTSGEHLARLIGDVLDMATSEAGQLRILREPLDLKEVLQVVMKIGDQLAREKGLSWQANLPDPGTMVIGDLTRLRQITINLISNAVKFTPQGQVVLKVEIDDKTATISISDTGVGVSSTEQEKIFREFYRTENAVQAGYGGLGLGLAITKQLLEQHGGHIGVRSPGDLGCGSTFFYTLPIISRDTSKTERAASFSIPANSVVVLSEQNDPNERLCNHLSERGFTIRVFQVDKQIDWLSEVISSPPVALIFGDQLAARQGWVIMGMLKRQPATEHIPVFAYSIDEERDQGELLELNYLQKPLRLEGLREELSHCSTPEKGKLTILIIDDEPGILNVHRRLVEQLGCKAITAGNGIEGLQVIEKTKPDLILLDLMMPEMDGFAFMSALKKRETMRNIPIIVLTARVLSEEDLERLNNGVTTILSKGIFSSGEILNRIEAVLTRRHTLGQATQQIVRQAMAYIHTHFAESLNREAIARHVGISADYLTDCFRQELYITPMIYLRRYRILHARELLETTNLSITQVAFEVGFSESAHFTRLFQREVGMTPRAYRHTRMG